MPRKDLIQFRRGGTALWSGSNPTLAYGEPGYDEDLDLLKLGDGVLDWANLPAIGAGGSGPTPPPVWFPVIVQGFTNVEIQAAIDSVPANGGTVWFPPGEYAIGATVALADNVTLIGSGAVVLKPTGVIARVFHGVGLSNIRIEGLEFNGDLVAPGTHARMVELQNGTDISLNRCRVIDASSTGFLLSGTNLRVEKSVFINGYVSGVRIDADAISGVSGAGSPDAPLENHNIWITDNYFENCQWSDIGGNAPIQTHGTTTPHNWSVTITGNTVIGGYVGIGADSIEDSVIAYNVVDLRRESAPTYIVGEGIAFTGSGNTIDHNTCIGNNVNSSSGIMAWCQFHEMTRNRITNNDCSYSGQGISFVWGEGSAPLTISKIQITDNICHHNNIGIQSYFMPGVTTGIQKWIQIDDNMLVDNVVSPYNILQGSGGVTGYASLSGNKVVDFFVNDMIMNTPYNYVATFGSGADITLFTSRSTNETGAQAIQRYEGRFSGTTNTKSAGVYMRRPASSEHVQAGLFGWNHTTGQRVDGVYVDENRNTVTPGGGWNTGHWVLGTWHFWVDTAAGAFRKKNGAPTSDTDGTLV